MSRKSRELIRIIIYLCVEISEVVYIKKVVDSVTLLCYYKNKA